MSYAVYPLRHIGIGRQGGGHLFSSTCANGAAGTRNANREESGGRRTMSDGLAIDFWKTIQDHILWVGVLLLVVRLV